MTCTYNSSIIFFVSFIKYTSFRLFFVNVIYGCNGVNKALARIWFVLNIHFLVTLNCFHKLILCFFPFRIYGFYDECKRRYNIKLWKTFTDCFNALPIAALIEGAIFCCHGGLSPDLYELTQLNDIDRPLDVPDHGLVCDLLWSDPDEDITGWGENDRGVSYTFGGDVVRSFLKKQDCCLIVRAHQVVEDGYQFFQKRKVTWNHTF